MQSPCVLEAPCAGEPGSVLVRPFGMAPAGTLATADHAILV